MSIKRICALCVCLLLSMALIPAMAEGVKLEGEIRASSTLSITAPYSGRVGDFTVQAGDALTAGKPLFTLDTQKIYAEFDGTVTGLFAQAGDSTAAVQAYYGALCSLERTALYAAECSTSGAASDNENKIIHPGETVYLRSSTNTDRDGVGRVVSVSGSSYTVEVTDEGDLRLNEQVKIYREKSYSSNSCIGSGRLVRNDPVPVQAEGYVLRVAVSEGQAVHRGDVLFEIVPEAQEGLSGGDGVVTMPEDGVLLSVSAQSGVQVSQHAVLATYCPADAMELVCDVDEDDLAAVKLGARVNVTLDAYPEQTLEGEVVSIASAGTENGSRVTFEVTIALRSTENVRLGMNATAAL